MEETGDALTIADRGQLDHAVEERVVLLFGLDALLAHEARDAAREAAKVVQPIAGLDDVRASVDAGLEAIQVAFLRNLAKGLDDSDNVATEAVLDHLGSEVARVLHTVVEQRCHHQLRLVDLDLIQQNERDTTRVLEVALRLAILAELLSCLRAVTELGERVGELNVEQRARREVRLQTSEEGVAVLVRHLGLLKKRR